MSTDLMNVEYDDNLDMELEDELSKSTTSNRIRVKCGESYLWYLVPGKVRRVMDERTKREILKRDSAVRYKQIYKVPAITKQDQDYYGVCAWHTHRRECRHCILITMAKAHPVRAVKNNAERMSQREHTWGKYFMPVIDAKHPDLGIQIAEFSRACYEQILATSKRWRQRTGHHLWSWQTGTVMCVVVTGDPEKPSTIRYQGVNNAESPTLHSQTYGIGIRQLLEKTKCNLQIDTLEAAIPDMNELFVVDPDSKVDQILGNFLGLDDLGPKRSSSSISVEGGDEAYDPVLSDEDQVILDEGDPASQAQAEAMEEAAQTDEGGELPPDEDAAGFPLEDEMGPGSGTDELPPDEDIPPVPPPVKPPARPPTQAAKPAAGVAAPKTAARPAAPPLVQDSDPTPPESNRGQRTSDLAARVRSQITEGRNKMQQGQGAK